MNNRPGIVSVVLVLLLLFVGWSYREWALATEEMAAAAERLNDCRSLARQIETLRLAPTQFDDTERSSEALSQLVESATSSAGINGERIAQISPDAPRRVEDSPYKEQQIRVELNDVTLPQTIRFLLNVPKQDPSVHISTLFLRTPAQRASEDEDAQAAELWNAEAVLTSRFYAPIVGPKY